MKTLWPEHFWNNKSNGRLPSCLSPLFQSEAKSETFHMEISFIHMQSFVHLHVNRTHFHVKGFARGNRLLEVSV